MKIIIASDIHGDAVCAERLLKIYKESGASRLLLLGDVLYHGPRNALPAGYAPAKVADMLNEIKDEIICVRGNCDAEVDGMVLKFPIMSEMTVVEADGVRMVATHGHHYNAENPPALAKGDVLLGGHTHVPCIKSFGNENVFLNPGSLSIPKENSAHSYILFDSGNFMFYTLEGEEYMSYFSFEKEKPLF